MSCVISPPLLHIQAIIAVAACTLCINAPAAQANATSCLDAAAYAEQSLLLPTGLLKSVGFVETGNQPWSVNVDGVGHRFSSATEAISFVRLATRSGGHYIDVGCFQIDLLYHPEAFSSLEAAFDPVANAMAAGRFLLSLEQTTSSWADAVGRYHSSLPLQAMAYAKRVYTAIGNTPSTVGRPKIDLDNIMFGIRVSVPDWSANLHSLPLRLAGLPIIQTP